jgi:hypothetical protein
MCSQGLVPRLPLCYYSYLLTPVTISHNCNEGSVIRDILGEHVQVVMMLNVILSLSILADNRLTIRAVEELRVHSKLGEYNW